jgi:phage terminase large subunit-like protein
MSTAQKLESAGYTTVEIRQHSSVLHPPTKLLKESILQGHFQYTENKLYEINFQNCRCQYDSNKNLFITKKKSRGKIDMVISTINALYLLQQDCLLGTDGFIVQSF